MGQRACRIEIIQILFFFWCLDLENSKFRQCNLANFMAGNEDLNIQGKLVFDRLIGNLDCITHHEEYKAITNKAVLQTINPMTSATARIDCLGWG